MTYRELLDMLRQHAADYPDDEALDRQVIVRVVVEDELHVGGLRSISIDSGCTDEPALTLDADGDSE